MVLKERNLILQLKNLKNYTLQLSLLYLSLSRLTQKVHDPVIN